MRWLFSSAFAQNKNSYIKYTALMTVVMSALSCCFLLLIASMFTTDSSNEFGILQVYALQVQLPSYCFQVWFLMFDLNTKMYFTISYDQAIFLMIGGYCRTHAEYHNILDQYHYFDKLFLKCFRSQLMIPKTFAIKNPCILRVILFWFKEESKLDTNYENMNINVSDVKSDVEMTSINLFHNDKQVNANVNSFKNMRHNLRLNEPQLFHDDIYKNHYEADIKESPDYIIRLNKASRKSKNKQ
jgi:hypothetical protein